VALTSNLRLVVAAVLTATRDLSTVGAAAPVGLDLPVTLATGTGAGQADRMFADSRTIAASGTDDLDLAGTALSDGLGVAFSIARLKALVVRADEDNTNNVIVGGAAATQFASWVGGAAHTVTLRPGAFIALVAGEDDATGYTVGAGASDLLRISNSAGGSAVNYDIVLIGASA
jgi:hypothetical protein